MKSQVCIYGFLNYLQGTLGWEHKHFKDTNKEEGRFVPGIRSPYVSNLSGVAILKRKAVLKLDMRSH